MKKFSLAIFALALALAITQPPWLIPLITHS